MEVEEENIIPQDIRDNSHMLRLIQIKHIEMQIEHVTIIIAMGGMVADTEEGDTMEMALLQSSILNRSPGWEIIPTVYISPIYDRIHLLHDRSMSLANVDVHEYAYIVPVPEKCSLTF